MIQSPLMEIKTKAIEILPLLGHLQSVCNSPVPCYRYFICLLAGQRYSRRFKGQKNTLWYLKRIFDIWNVE